MNDRVPRSPKVVAAETTGSSSTMEYGLLMEPVKPIKMNPRTIFRTIQTTRLCVVAREGNLGSRI